jgi:hypothetical protein
LVTIDESAVPRRTAIARPGVRIAFGKRVLVRARRLAPFAVALAVAAWVLVRSNWTSTPDGDPALHLKLIQDIASTHHLPTVLPNFPARVGDGGQVQVMFPYVYTPLYHVIGALAYSLGGVTGVLAVNAFAASMIAFVVYRFVARGAPWFIAAASGCAVMLSPTVITPFRSPYMEPLMLGFLVPGAWCTYLALTTRQARFGLLAGLLLGLSIATRQNALAFVLVIGAVVAVHLAERRVWRRGRLRQELPWMLALAAGGLAASAPALLYLAHVNGSIGYADLSLPGMATRVPVDPAANGYVAGITKPHLSTLAWLDRYRSVLVYSEAWAPRWYSIVPMALFVLGAIHMNRRGGGGRFFARWAVIQVALDMLVFTTLHGNGRYVIVAQILFYSLVPVGIYSILRGLSAFCEPRPRVRVPALVLAAAMAPVALFWLFPAGTADWDVYAQTGDRDLRQFRGAEYAEMGQWVNQNTPADSLILTPRAYTALLTWERNVTWVTFYGNAWIVDAISTTDPRKAHDILASHGVDYVLVPDPPGSYVDSLPDTGMRSYLQLGVEPPASFELVHLTESDGALFTYGRSIEHGLRLYHVVPDVKS